MNRNTQYNAFAMALLSCLFLLLIAQHAHAGLWGTVKGIFGKTENTTNIAEQKKENNMKLGVIESLVRDIKVDVDANNEITANGQAGMGNKITEMRDSINKLEVSFSKVTNKIDNSVKNLHKEVTQSNQASIFYVLSIVLGGVCLGLIGLIGFLIPQFIDKGRFAKELDQLRKENRIK